MNRWFLMVLCAFGVMAAAVAADARPVAFSEKELRKGVRENFASLQDGVLKVYGNPSHRHPKWLPVFLDLGAAPVGKTICLEGDVKTELSAGMFMVAIKITDAQGKSISYQGPTFRSSQDWQHFTRKFKVPENGATLSLFVVGRDMDAKSYGMVKNITWKVLD